MDAIILSMCLQGRTVDAIKVYMLVAQCPLSEARQAVEKIAKTFYNKKQVQSVNG